MIGGGGGERRKAVEKERKEPEGEESRDQSLVWDYVCSDNILHLTHFFLSGQVFHGLSGSFMHTHTHTYTHTHACMEHIH